MKSNEEILIVMFFRIWLVCNLENYVYLLMYVIENDGFRVINEV